MQPPDLTAEVHDYIARAFEALDRGSGPALARLEAPRRYNPAHAERALEMLVASLAGYAIGLVGASIAGALARHAAPATASAVREELVRIAQAPAPARRAPHRPDVERALAPPRLLTIDDLRELLRARLLDARADAHAVVTRIVAVAIAHAPHDAASFARVLGARHADDLVPCRFGEQIETSWRATCDALALDRAPPAPARAKPILAEPAENYCWMRIR